MKEIIYYTVVRQIEERRWQEIAAFVDREDADRLASEDVGWYGAQSTAQTRILYLNESYDEWELL